MISRRDYEGLLETRIRSLEAIQEDGTAENAAAVLAAERERAELAAELELSRMRSAGIAPDSREADEAALTLEMERREKAGREIASSPEDPDAGDRAWLGDSVVEKLTRGEDG